MIRKTIFCVCLIMLLARSGYGGDLQDFNAFNGNNWQEWDKDDKGAFVVGFASGSCYIVEKNMDEINQYLIELKTEKGEKISEYLQGSASHEKIRNSQLKRYSIYNITAGQIVEGVDILYKDFKNKGIRISDAIYVVKRQIQGTSPEDIEKILIYLRCNYENYEALVTRDKNGGVINSVEFP